MISFSRNGDSRSDARREWMCGFQSGMLPSRDQAHRLHELIPGLALSGQHALAGGCQAIKAAPALACLLDPRALDPTPFLESIEKRVQGVEVKHQPAA